MLLLPTTTRWLCIPSLLLLILVQDGTCQLSFGAKDAFLLEDLDGDGAKLGAGNVPEESSSLDAASNPATNAAGVDALATKASDSSSPEPTQTDAVLTSPPTDEPFEDNTNNDFDDYMTDEQVQTTESSNPPTDSISSSTGDTDQYDYPSEDRKEAEEVTSSVPQLTRRIVFAGPSVTPTVSEPSAAFSRPSSVVRGLDNSDIDAWLPNWPSELLQNSGGPTRRPTIRFPTEPPLSVFDSTPTASPVLTVQPTINPSYTVSKVPVTQYYFDLTSVAPSPVPGPLFDEEDLKSSSLASPTIRPDLTHQIIELSSSLSGLQSSSLVEAARPLSMTPILSVSQDATVTIPGFVTSSTASITPSPTPALSEAPTRADEGLESEMVDNKLDGDSDSDSKTLVEDPQAHDTETSGPRPPQSHPDPQDANPDYTENPTVGDVLIQASTTVTAGELPGTSEVQSVTTTTTTTTTISPASEASSELVTATSTSTPSSSKKPNSFRPSQAVNSSRTPLWVLLSQSAPSRSVNTQPPSMQQPSPIPSTIPATELANPVTSLTSPSDDDHSSPSPDALSTSTMLSFPSRSSSTTTQEIPSSDQSVSLNASSPQPPDPSSIDAAEVPDQPEDGSVSVGISGPSVSTAEPPQNTNPDIIPGEESPDSTVNPLLDSELMISREDAVITLANTSSVEYTENTLDNTSLPDSSSDVNILADTNAVERPDNTVNNTPSPVQPNNVNNLVNTSTSESTENTLNNTSQSVPSNDVNTAANTSSAEITRNSLNRTSPPISSNDINTLGNTSNVQDTENTLSSTSLPISSDEANTQVNTGNTLNNTSFPIPSNDVNTQANTGNPLNNTSPPIPSNEVNSLANTSSIEYTENTLNYTSPPVPSNEVTLNKTEHENDILEEPIVITLPEETPTLPDLQSESQPDLLSDLPTDLQPDQGESVSSVSPIRPTEVSEAIPTIDNSPWTPVIEQTDNAVQSVPVITSHSSVTTSTSLVTTDPPELIGGFTPIVTVSTSTSFVSYSEVVTESSRVASPTSPTAVVESTASLQSSSTRSAQLPNMIDSSAPTSVHRTSVELESIMPNDQSFEDEHLTSDVMFTKDELMSSITPLPTAVQTSMKNELTPFPETPGLSEPLPTLLSSDTLTPMTEPSIEKIPEPTMVVTEKMSSSSSSAPVFTPEVLPSHSDTTDHDTPSQQYSSTSSSPHIPPPPPPSTTIPPDAPVSSASVAILTTSSSPVAPNTDSHPLVAPTATGDPTETPTHTVHPEGPVVEVTEEGTHEEHPEKEPGIVKDETLPVSTHTPPSSDSPSLLPTSSVDSPPPVTSIPSSPTSPPVTTSPELPSITTPEPTRVASSEVIPVISEAPVPVTTPEPKTVTTPPITSPQPPPFSVTTPLTTTTEKSTTLTPPPTTTTSPVTTPEPTYASPTEPEPSLTTTMLLPNGSMVEAPLPHIRALVTYTSMEFCRHRRNFRSMFSQWITQHLAGQAMVKPKDIKFFNMPTCPANPPPSPEEDNMNDIEDQSEDRATNVYFYITRSGVMDPNLTEQFPRFPMDLEIDEDLIYLRPKVTQLELVRGHGASNTDLLLEEEAAIGTSVIVIIVICSIVGITIILALLFFMVVKRRGATNNYYGRRCTPVSMDAYSMDSVSVYHSFRRKSKRRASGRSIKSYLNQAFDDPNGPSRPLNFAKLTHFISDIDGVYEEFGTIPVNMPKYDELPAGVEDKNRYANVIPVPETRVLLKANKESRNSEYINANYVRGARNESKYYIATQAPLDDTVADFWRMIWEQETRVVVMLTDFVEKGIDKCADYLPPSETLDCHRLYGDFQVTLKSRDMKEKFVVSNVQLKNLENNLVREVAHMWFTGWPASGVPNEEAGFISFILEVRRTRKKLRAKGPIVVHCSPGTGRTGTLLACDIVMKQFEDQRSIDVPRTVYSIRRDRAGAVQTKEQYAFIYRVINLYASKLTSGNLDSL